MATLNRAGEAPGNAFRLEGELNIFHGARLRDELLSLLAEHADLELDLADVVDCDSCGIQLLLLLKREARRQDKRLALVNHSACVAEVIELLNLGMELGDPLVLPADHGRASA